MFSGSLMPGISGGMDGVCGCPGAGVSAIVVVPPHFVVLVGDRPRLTPEGGFGSLSR
jgi:hypothetical protein